MTMLLAFLAVSAVSFAAGWRSASHFQIAQREARDELRFWERESLTVLPEAAPR